MKFDFLIFLTPLWRSFQAIRADSCELATLDCEPRTIYPERPCFACLPFSLHPLLVTFKLFRHRFVLYSSLGGIHKLLIFFPKCWFLCNRKFDFVLTLKRLHLNFACCCCCRFWSFFRNSPQSNINITWKRNGILLPKLLWPTVWINCSSDR